ncbi:MAG TPA: hypothetical protein VK653_06710 [Xanthobacteraceae bacterium]|nr:hypothetical protein [Xanthobacteraceae bacterium]
MKTICLIASALLAGALVSGVALAPAQAKTMKECAAEWDKMKAAKQTGGMKYRDFSKQCMAGGAAAAPAAPTTAAPAPATTPTPAPATTTAKPATGSAGRQAMIARERACGAEWKADKAAGKIQAGMKWPQYWSDCDKRKKAQGM